MASTTYKFEQVIPDTKVGTQEIPASFAGIDQEGNITADSMYSNTRTLWIEPETGVLIKGQEQQYNYFAYEGDEVITTTDALHRLQRRDGQGQHRHLQAARHATQDRPRLVADHRPRPRPPADRPRRVLGVAQPQRLRRRRFQDVDSRTPVSV